MRLNGYTHAEPLNNKINFGSKRSTAATEACRYRELAAFADKFDKVAKNSYYAAEAWASAEGEGKGDNPVVSRAKKNNAKKALVSRVLATVAKEKKKKCDF